MRLTPREPTLRRANTRVLAFGITWLTKPPMLVMPHDPASTRVVTPEWTPARSASCIMSST